MDLHWVHLVSEIVNYHIHPSLWILLLILLTLYVVEEDNNLFWYFLDHPVFYNISQITDPCSDTLNLSKSISGTNWTCGCCPIESIHVFKTMFTDSCKFSKEQYLLALTQISWFCWKWVGLNKWCSLQSVV